MVAVLEVSSVRKVRPRQIAEMMTNGADSAERLRTGSPMSPSQPGDLKALGQGETAAEEEHDVPGESRNHVRSHDRSPDFRDRTLAWE